MIPNYNNCFIFRNQWQPYIQTKKIFGFHEPNNSCVSFFLECKINLKILFRGVNPFYIRLPYSYAPNFRIMNANKILLWLLTHEHCIIFINVFIHK